jgi:dCMP deaminase
MPRLDIHKVYMNIAAEIGQLSYAERKKVGCLIVKDSSIISYGYNGTPTGFDNNCEDPEPHGNVGDLITKKEVLHSESNAISKVAKSSNSSDGADMYVTLSPCFECSKLIIQSGIKRLFYREEYRLTEGLELLRKAGVQCVQC